jgi:molybdopterin molybdotransferase
VKPDLISFEDAVEAVLRETKLLGVEPVSLDAACGRVLAEPVRAPFDLPHETASLMDGFAVRAAEISPGSTLNVAFEIPAGRTAPRPLGAGECARILTGAPLPLGADAVVKQEDCSREGDAVTFRQPISAGEHVRAAGSDARQGDVLIEAGTVMDAGALALAATVGAAKISVSRRPTIAILATGDELRPVGSTLAPGTIYESNTFGLAAQAMEVGATARVLGTAPDEPARISEALVSVEADIYVTSGGASVGDYDFARDVLERLGGRKVFWQVAIRPGKPILFGVIERPLPALFFALPGNPGASALTFDLLVRVAARAMMGVPRPRRQRVEAKLEAPMKKPEGLTFLARGTLVSSGGELFFRAASLQGSMSIPSLKGLGAVAIVPASVSRLEAGSLVAVEPWASVEPA